MAQFITCTLAGISECQPQDEEFDSSMKAWRCDLTALSHRYNLYFVACNDQILVYQPEFPDQSISAGPKLILAPPVSAPDLPYYMDEDDPHSITHILVDYLGNDEVLLATCDDGDVVGYRVDTIRRAIDELDDYPDEDPPGIKRFLHRNVGRSAWGLAIHREARMIAISSNTHEVTVIAYALATDEDEPCTSESSGSELSLEDDFPSPRRRDHVLTLRSSHNIPSVAFNNNAEDPDGRWLFSTCISGEVVLWDLHDPDARARMFEMGWCINALHSDRAPRRHPGECFCGNAGALPHGAWGAMFLDPRSAHEIEPPDERPETTSTEPLFEDAGYQKERFRFESGTLSEAEFDVDDDESDGDGNEGDFSVLEGSPIMLFDDGDDGLGQPMAIDDSSSQEGESDDQEDNDHDVDDHDVDDHDNDGDDGHDAEPNWTGFLLPSMQTTPPNPFPNTAESALSALWSYATLTPDQTNTGTTFATIITTTADDTITMVTAAASSTAPFIGYRHMAPRPNAYCQIRDRTSFPYDSTPHPALIITQDALFLLQSPFAPSPRPILALRTPLQAVPASMPFGRLCFSVCIPQLGVFVVGSPVGRVAIFALTKYWKDGGWTFGFRLEYILPRGRDEEQVLSVMGRLCGVAVAPVQGGEGEGKWRLLMYFGDHRVVGWEIERRGGGGVGELVV